MANILDALNLVANTADSEQKQPPKQKSKTTLTPDYVAKNKQDIQNTFSYNPDSDYNAKIKNFLGLGN